MEYRFSDRMKNLSANAIREIFKLLSKPEIISFAGGLPSNEGLPLDKIKELTQEILSSDKALSILQYGATEGYSPFLMQGLEYIKRAGIYNQSKENILAVSGGQQGIDLMFKAFLNKGDYALVEEPTYLAALHILKTYQAVPVGVKSGDDGIDLDDLEQKMKQYNPKILYLVPTFGNPTGKTISEAKREKIAQLCARYSVIAIEDDPYCELRYEGKRLRSIKSFDKTGNVVYIISFSKTISPGLRTAFAVGSKEIIRKMALGKQATDVHTSSLSQAIVEAYLRKGYMDPHLKKVIPIYKSKKDLMLQKMQEYFPEGIEYTKPEGGLFIWVTLPSHMDANELFMDAVAENVAFVCGDSFYPQANVRNNFRLNFSNATPEQIDEGIKRIAKVIKKHI
ncbi:MAG TPA: PLP-dependent aminotransferase family protein [Clostridiales bacterium]|nr:PLP-dependent aminotransferase family protein [Clostridiales bacterium]